MLSKNTWCTALAILTLGLVIAENITRTHGWHAMQPTRNINVVAEHAKTLFYNCGFYFGRFTDFLYWAYEYLAQDAMELLASIARLATATLEVLRGYADAYTPDITWVTWPMSLGCLVVICSVLYLYLGHRWPEYARPSHWVSVVFAAALASTPRSHIASGAAAAEATRQRNRPVESTRMNTRGRPYVSRSDENQEE